MIKRSSGFFKIAFFIFCLFIGLFLILFSMTDIRNYVTTEICIFAFCISIVVIPLIIEIILYAFGVLTKCIRVSSKKDNYNFTPMKNSKIPYASLNDNGVEKMMFFCEKGKIIILSANNTEIIWGSDKNEIEMHSKFCECFSFYKSIYGTKYENVECTVYTSLQSPEKEETTEKTSVQREETNTTNNIKQPDIVPTTQTSQPMPQAQPTIPELEGDEQFDYRITDSDTLYEATIEI